FRSWAGPSVAAQQHWGRASVVSTGYGAAGAVLGGMGVLGPTRMDYPGTMASVATVARYIGEVLAER
ncbi:hypothetical protein ACWDNR_24525, partial [Gordonia aichiensis]